MQVDIEKSNERFQRIFQSFNLLWVIISVISITFATYSVLSAKPAYLHDWHGIAIIGLALFVMVVYAFGLYSRVVFQVQHQWPPAFQRAFIYWSSVYIGVLLLSMIDADFSWCLFIVMGISFALFNAPRLLLCVSITVVTLSAFQGLFSWPLTMSNLGSLFGLGLAFFSMTVSCMFMQHLIGGWHERNDLLAGISCANRELEEAHRQLAESAAQEQELAVLRERTRLAREMHDTLGHALALVSVKLEVAQRLRERDPERCDRELEATREIVRTSMNELRASIANLRSPALEREPACRAISRYAREMAQRAGLRVSYDLHPGIEGLPEPIEETLWKVGQEALTNIEKHARASNVLLHISCQDGIVIMRIQDDGIGLPEVLYHLHEDGRVICASPEGHFGLSGMRERVENCGGYLHLSPAEEHGTIVEVELPLVEAPLASTLEAQVFP
ncbi:MAG TPA: sensor histidine kinase [Ktedonobacteraceae bacterium]|nr:sensor histidine kinase [Ktedonobacteraceae bacterium]